MEGKHRQSVPADSAPTAASDDHTYSGAPPSLAGSHKWPHPHHPHHQQDYPHPTPALSRDITDWTGDGTVTMIGGYSVSPAPLAHISPDRIQPRGKGPGPAMSEETVACGVASGSARGYSGGGGGGDGDPSESICSAQGKQEAYLTKKPRIRYYQAVPGQEAADEAESSFMPRSAARRHGGQPPAFLRSASNGLFAKLPGRTGTPLRMGPPLRMPLAALQRTSAAPPARFSRKLLASTTQEPGVRMGAGSPRLAPTFDSAPHPWAHPQSSSQSALPGTTPPVAPLYWSHPASDPYGQHQPCQRQAHHTQALLRQRHSIDALTSPGTQPGPTHTPSALKTLDVLLPPPESPLGTAVLPLLTPIMTQDLGQSRGGSGGGADIEWCAEGVAAVEARWDSGFQAPHWTPFPRGSRAAETGGSYVPENMPHSLDVEE